MIKGFGFTSLQTTLAEIPYSVISFLTMVATGWLSGRYSNIITFLISGVIMLPIIGTAIIYGGADKGVKLFAYYLMATSPANMPLIMSLMAINFRGSTKRFTMMAMMFIGYCAGNMYVVRSFGCLVQLSNHFSGGPHLFRRSDAPHYRVAFEGLMISYILALFLTLVLRAYLIWCNRQLDAAAALQGNNIQGSQMELTQTHTQSQEENPDAEDLTDRKTIWFRYRT